jgi:tellurite methyltransferase
LIEKAKYGLVRNGIIYIRTFNTEEPGYVNISTKLKKIDERTFYNAERDTYFHFFSRDELEEIFKDYKIILLLNGIQLDIGHGEPHYHGTIELIAQKL